MLRRWDLEPLIIDQLASKGQTIIEKLEEYTGQANFGIVLATPDDVGYAKDHEDDKKFRARQNVVLELGMLLAKIGRSKVAIQPHQTIPQNIVQQRAAARNFLSSSWSFA